MMRRINTIGGCLALLLLAGCSGDTDGVRQQPVPISLTCSEYTIVEAQTRAGVDVHNSIVGENVNIYMPDNTLSGPIVYSVTSTTEANGKNKMTPASAVYLYPDETPIYGFYPINVTMSDGKVSYSVQTNQGAEADYMLSDLLFAKNTVVKSSIATPVNLVFYHLMSKVIVKVKKEDADGIDIVGIRIANIGKTLEYSPGTYEVDVTGVNSPPASGLTVRDDVGETGITAGTTGNFITEATTIGDKAGTITTCAALIPPQTVGGKKFILIDVQGSGDKSHNSGTVAYEIPSGASNSKTFKPGYTYTLTLGLDRWSFGQTMNISVSNWSSEENIAAPRLSI